MEKYCLIGKSLPHTLSPEIHAEFGLDYSAVELENENALAEFLKSRKFRGFNVTIPYKTVIMKYLDKTDGLAEKIGAVNTVVERDGKLFGFNTDFGGLEYALNFASIDLSGKNVMILGSGGASKTVSCLAKERGAKSVAVVSRSGGTNYENLYGLTKTQVLFNATPVGMFPNTGSAPADVNEFKNLEAVFDLVYNPLCTRLLFEAKERGLKAENGLRMLVEQARLARNIFADGEAAQDDTERILKSLEKKYRNVVLIGMAGAGKTSIGKLLAKNLGCKFVDTDEEVEKAVGTPVCGIIEKYGEKRFRELEKAAVNSAAKERGIVIATGGGAVVDRENRIALKASGLTVLVNRDLEKLETAGRPLSSDAEKAAKLWEQRKNIYKAFADLTVENDTTALDAANKIAEKL